MTGLTVAGRIPTLHRCKHGTRDPLQGLRCSNRAPRWQGIRQACRASMDTDSTQGLAPFQPDLQHYPPDRNAMYGLNTRQMAVLGLTDASVAQHLEENEELLSAKTAYAGGTRMSGNMRYPTQMRRGGGRGGRMKKGKKPPDLPSKLLDGRICYIGMPLLPAVAELIVAELLWLNYASEDPMYIYINSIGSQTEHGQMIAQDVDAYSILDTICYMRSATINTVAVSQAYGTAAMILAAGTPGKRFAQPHARIKTVPPRINRNFGPVSDVMIRSNELEHNMKIHTNFMSVFTGQDRDKVRQDLGRNRYYTPEEAIEYGIIDSLVPQGQKQIGAKTHEAWDSHVARRQQRVPAGAGAGGGAEPATGY